MPYEVKDITLAEQGFKNIEWAETQMGALLKVRERFEKEKLLKGYRVGMALHITKETAVLVRTLIAGGAEVAITSCNPLSTQDDVAAALAKEGIEVYGYKGESTEDYYRFIKKVLDFNPHVTIDDGCDLVSEVHKSRTDLIEQLVVGCEETTTGIIRLKAMEKDNALHYPIIAVNDCDTKHLMDNYYGTGQSTLDGLIRASNILLSGKTMVVLGYGNCGKGVSLRAKGLGANVIVTCAEGHPSTVMALSFCDQALAVEYGIKNKGKLAPGVHYLPEELDMQVAILQLEAMDVSIDTLTEEQIEYLNSWQEGT